MLTVLLILLEGGLMAFVAFDHNWEKVSKLSLLRSCIDVLSCERLVPLTLCTYWFSLTVFLL